MASYNYGGWTSCSFPPHIPFFTLKYNSQLHNSTNSYTFKNTTISPDHLTNSTTSPDNVRQSLALQPIVVCQRSVVRELNRQLHQQYSPYLEPASYLPPRPHTATFPLSPLAASFQSIRQPQTLFQRVPANDLINPADDPESWNDLLSKLGITETIIPAQEVTVTGPSDPPVDLQGTQNVPDAADKALKPSTPLQDTPQQQTSQPSWDTNTYGPEKTITTTTTKKRYNDNRSKRNNNRRCDTRSRPNTSRPTERIRPAPVAALPGWRNAFEQIKADDRDKYERDQEEKKRVGEVFHPAMTETYKRKGKKEVEVYGEIAGKAKVDAE